MRRSRRTRTAITLGAALALCITPNALGAFALTSTAAPSFSITLNGANRTANYTVPLTIDNSAIGVSLTGWNATITSTRFSGGGRSLATTSSTMTGVTSSCAGVCASNPTNSITYPIAVPAGSTAPAAVKFFNAANATGVGTFTVTPTVLVAIPANAYAASYATTLTLTLAVGP
jgi:hypothetical protein